VGGGKVRYEAYNTTKYSTIHFCTHTHTHIHTHPHTHTHTHTHIHTHTHTHRQREKEERGRESHTPLTQESILEHHFISEHFGTHFG